MQKLKIAVLCGGSSAERNISLQSGKAVFKAMKLLGHDVIAIDPALGPNCLIDIENMEISPEAPSAEQLLKFPSYNFVNAIFSPMLNEASCCFNMVHGTWGEDGHLSSLLDFRRVKYTGTDVKGSALAMDKHMSKKLFQASGITTPSWYLVGPNVYNDEKLIKDIRSEFGREMVIKPSDQGSALGMTIVKGGNLDDITNAIKLASKYSKRIILEKYISGRELTVPIVGGDMFPIVEIKPIEGHYDYQNKYTKGKTEYVCPADLTPDVEDFIMNTALAAHNALGLGGYSRIDFKMDEDFIGHCLEANTVPGFTELSLLPMSAKAAGLEFAELCQKLIDIAIEKK